MNPFKVLQIRKNIKEARENPSNFAGEQAKDFLWGVFLVPIVICFLIVGVFFVVGYTDILGFQLGFFKFLFWVALFVSLAIFSLLRKIVRFISKKASKEGKRFINVIGRESSGGNNNNQ